MKVKTKDFQRLKGDNTFEFPVGITVIQGRSGSGKSSLFYAIEDCLSNPSGIADVINWDAKSCEVSIENNNNSLTWKKTPSSCEYIDSEGKPYIKASKIDSRNICDLGFYFDKKDNIVNIHSEWSKLFPFEASDTEMFKLFEDIFNISSSFQIIDEIKKDEQSIKSKISDINNNINSYTINNNSIDNVLQGMDSLNSSCSMNAQVFLSKLSELENNLQEINADLQVLQKQQKYITSIKNEDIIFQQQCDVNLDTLYTLSNEVSAVKSDLAKYKDYNKILSATDLQSAIDEDAYERATLLLGNLGIKSKGIVEIMGALMQYNMAQNTISDNEKQILKLNAEEDSIRERLKEIKVCPTCGQPISSEVLSLK